MDKEREALDSLIAHLRTSAAKIPEMDPGPERTQYFKDTVTKVVRDWHKNRDNMAHFWRAFFGKGTADTGVKFLEKTSDKVVGGLMAGGIAGATVKAVIASSATAGLAAATPTLFIGLTYQSVNAYLQVRAHKRASRYRFLTLMEKNGVVFRSDLHGFK